MLEKDMRFLCSSFLLSSLRRDPRKYGCICSPLSHSCDVKDSILPFGWKSTRTVFGSFADIRAYSKSQDQSSDNGSQRLDADIGQQKLVTSNLGRLPLEKQFETWIHNLRPGFSHQDVENALRAQSDADLALDIFRWTAQQRNYRHNAATYQTMIEICIVNRRRGQAETLVEEVIAGACPGTDTLYNSMIRFYCSQRSLFNRAFDIFKKMQKLPECKPTLETYVLLLKCLLGRFNRLHVSYVYMHSVRSLVKHMKASGVIPDTLTQNLIIKAYSLCHEMDEALRTFREMSLYGSEPNNFTYSYLAKGLCEKGRTEQGLNFYKEMRKKGFVPTSSTFMVVICSMSLEHRFEEAIEATFDMIANAIKPDPLTVKTLLEELCRGGRENDAFELLEQLRREASLDGKTYATLSNALHWFRQD